MKIIDLLNKIANGKEIPERIIYGNEEYSFNYKDMTYYCCDHDMTDLLNSNLIGNILNDEVEIIEEDKKIKRIQSCGDNLYSEYIGQGLVNKENYTEYDELLMNKINEIIDKLNKGE